MSFIREYGNLGTVEKPDIFFEGTASLRLQLLPSEGEEDKLIYWGGKTGGTYLGLGGSSHHLLGAKPGGWGQSSAAYSIGRALDKQLREDSAKESTGVERKEATDLLGLVVLMAEPIDPSFLQGWKTLSFWRKGWRTTPHMKSITALKGKYCSVRVSMSRKPINRSDAWIIF